MPSEGLCQWCGHEAYLHGDSTTLQCGACPSDYKHTFMPEQRTDRRDIMDRFDDPEIEIRRGAR